MSRVPDICLRRATVSVMFLCMLALTLCQVLGPTARLHNSLAPADFTERALAGRSLQAFGGHIPLPSRCASIKLAPVEITAIDLAPESGACSFARVGSLPPPPSTELGVPTPPPRAA
ncbi:hypothetical protein [Taklimakanibacter lacteus]|uniref:hypothetical protein n=1 Tax=Taklimakanibacter lacteus TaxID=2268456 RepID=UPI000E66C6D2